MANRRSLDAVSTDPAPAPDSKVRRPGRSRKPDSARSSSARLAPEARHALIAEAAYLRSERRGFEPGHETEDWLAAEAEVDALLRVEQGPQ